MADGIYELIMLLKVIVIVKPELLTTVLFFWNNRTNTFDFRMGLISPMILDIAQIFGLRPSGRCVDITYDWSSPSHLTAESSGAFEFITRTEYTSSTFKSYATSFANFITFVKKTFSLPSPTADRD